MTAVVVLADCPATGISQHANAHRIRPDALAGPGAASEFVTYAAQGLRERKAVLALYPAWLSAVARRFVRLARLVHDTDRIAGLPLNLPPVAFSLVADQLSYLAQYVSPGLLASLAHRLPQETFAGAWVNSVTRLEHIETGLGKHVMSYLPGTGFMVSAAPHQSVHRITADRPVAQLSYRPAKPVAMFAAYEDGDPDWLKGKLYPAIGAPRMAFVAAQPLSSEFWGTKKYVEFVAFSAHPDALRNAIQATPCRPCPWCGEPTALTACAFCSMIQPTPQVAQPQQAPYQPPTSVQPTPHQPARAWREQARASPGVPSPQPGRRSSPGEDRSASGERVPTVTFAVPHRQPQHGANGSAPMLDPPFNVK